MMKVYSVLAGALLLAGCETTQEQAPIVAEFCEFTDVAGTLFRCPSNRAGDCIKMAVSEDLPACAIDGTQEI